MKNKFTNLSLNVFIWALLLGLIGGIGADLFLRFYWLGGTSPVTTSGELDLSSGLYGRSNVVIQDPKKVVVNQDLKIQETVNAANDSLIGFFKRLPESTATSSNFNLNDYYDLTKPEFMGLSLTADGWIMVSSAKVNSRLDLKDYVAIGKDKKVYSLDEILEYKKHNLWMIHLAGADNLLVKNLLTAENLAVGQTLLAVNWNNDVALNSIVSLPAKSQIIKSSDRLNESLILDEAIDPRFKGSWLFGLGGDLVALVGDDLRITPVVNMNSAVYGFLKTKQFVTPFLGVNYLGLFNLASASSSQSTSYSGKNGALIVADESKVAVLKASPAEKAGIKSGDIIISVDNIEINVEHDLATVIQSYRPGDMVTIKFLRGGAVSSADIKLGELK